MCKSNIIVYCILFSIMLSCQNQENYKLDLGLYNETSDKLNTINQSFQFYDNEFSDVVLNLRETLVLQQDTIRLDSLDQLLFAGLAAPSFVQDSYSFGKTFGVEFSCMTIDNAPPDKIRTRANNLRLPTERINIPVAFHVIQSDDGRGYISRNQISVILDSINSHFSQSSISFSFLGLDSIRNNNWYKKTLQQNKYEKEMMEYLAVTPDKALNIYFLSLKGYKGYAYFPWAVKDDKIDGVVINNATIPGGSKVNFNQGKTITHEIGHYLGLYHTFHNGCEIGDDIPDTPPQSIPTKGCPVEKDSCPNLPGKDQINNYMDYSYDSCLNKFTNGQIDRMNWVLRKHRKGFLPKI
ncbi:MAG: zinc metalloprotease [Bacteroidota bacterium]